VARKKAVSTPSPPSPEKVARVLQSGALIDALAAAREVHRIAPTEESTSLLKRVLAAVAADFAERNKALEFNGIIAEADKLDPDDGDWLVERACLLARGGRLADALMRVDEAARGKVLAFAADRAIRTRSEEFIPDDMHAGFDAIQTAFRHHEAGNEAAAREALEVIGLRSPYLEWKVLLRGLLALAAGDKVRAVDNFTRLDAARLPARLASPLRGALDPEFKKSAPPSFAAKLEPLADRLLSNSLIKHLRDIAQNLGRDRPLTPAFRSAESAVLHLKKTAPDLVARLGNCLYQAILQQGQPEDMARYRRLFGAPPSDPNFHKLQAIIAEHIGDPAVAHQQWQRYEAWLAGNPLGWPPAVVARARAMVLTRMGTSAADHADPQDDDDLDGEFGFFAPPRRRKKKPKPLDPPAEDCFARAAQLAPDWDVASRNLFNALLDAGQNARAEETIRTFLAHQPNDLAAITSLADELTRQGRSEEAAEYWLRALEINPLDKPMRARTALAILASACRKMAGAPAAADADLDRHAALLDERSPGATTALRSVIRIKEGKLDEAAVFRQQALATPGSRLSSAYHMVVDSLLAKVKPADKRVVEKLFAEELAQPPAPVEVTLLIGAYDFYCVNALGYRGQKSHEKKVLDQVARCVDAEAPELDFERLATLLSAKKQWRLAKTFTDACIKRFRSNPHFLLVRSEAGLESGEPFYKVGDRLRKAQQLAEKSTEPRHRDLLDRISELLKEVTPQFNFLDAFFDRGPW
jgi:tetratricopeptide (TPR) repeat protein